MSRQFRPLKEKLANLEAAIEECEEGKSDLERRLGDPTSYRPSEEAKSLVDSYRQIQHSLHDLYQEWEVLMKQITQIEESS